MSTLSTTNLKNPSSGSNNIVLNADNTTTIAAPSNIIKSGTAVTSTSGVSIDFTGIPSWAKRITVMFAGVSTNGTSNLLIQVGPESGIVSAGYISASTASTTSGSNAGFIVTAANAAAYTHYGIATIALFNTANFWVSNSNLAPNASDSVSSSAGGISLSSTLDRVRITTVGGANTFDSGFINILYEG
jgi:hypothetical protein